MILKTKLSACVIFATSLPAIAEYQLISTKQLKNYAPYSQINHQTGSFFTSLNSINEGDFLFTEISLQDMNCSSKEKPIKIRTSDYYRHTPSLSINHSIKIALPTVDYLGQWYLMQINNKTSKIKKISKIKEIGVIRAGATSLQGYFFGGFDNKNHPLLIFYNTNLNNYKILSKNQSTEGEISSIFNKGDEIAAIYNERSKESSSTLFSSKLILYSSAGIQLSEVILDGLDGTGIGLDDGSMIVSYWESNNIYISKIGADLSVKWKMPLHQVKGIASTKGILLKLKKSMAWVGANNNMLVVHRFKQDGSDLSTRTESTHGLTVPQPLVYTAYAYGDEIHIRGRTNRGKGATLSTVTEFCLIEKP